MNRTPFRFLSLFPAAALAALAACTVPAAALAAVPASPAGGPAFRRSMERVPSLDPALCSSLCSAHAVQLVYEPLLDIDYLARPYRLIPRLAAEMPRPGPDGKTYRIRLRPDIRFQPDPCFGTDASGRPRGRAVTAEDAAFSLKRLADAKVSSPGSWLVLDSIAGMRAFHERSKSPAPTDYALPVAGLRVPDALTLEISLARPLHQFLWYLAMGYTAVVPREAVMRYGADFGSRAVGTGPYRLAEWRRNHRMVYTRDPAWPGWRTGPAAIRPAAAAAGAPFDRIVYSVIDDASTQWLCFLAGELDFLGEISRDNWDVVVDASGGLSEKLRERGVTLHSIPALEVAYVGINMDDPVLGPNKALRQALNCALDAPAWARFFNNRVIPCDGPVPPGTAGRLEAPFPYSANLEKARALLHRAGYPDGIDPKTGRRLELTLDLGRTSQDIRESTELLVSFFARAGIALVPQYHNWPAFLRLVAQRRSQMFRIGWIGDYPDAENFLQLFYGKNASPGPNRCNYANPAFDRLYEAACAEPSPEARDEIWRRAQAIVREDCPWIFLHFRKAYSLCGPRVKNYVPSDFPFGAERFLRTPAETP